MKDLYLSEIYSNIDFLESFLGLPDNLKDYDLFYAFLDKIKKDMSIYQECVEKERELKENGTKNENHDNN